jgi:hypothetical protein
VFGSRQIHQPFSWAELEISDQTAQTLFTHLDISPGFWAVLKLFGSKENAEHESAGGFNEGIRNDSDESFGKLQILSISVYMKFLTLPRDIIHSKACRGAR